MDSIIVSAKAMDGSFYEKINDALMDYESNNKKCFVDYNEVFQYK